MGHSEHASLRRAALDRRFPAWTPRSLAQVLDAADYGERPLVITRERAYSYAEIQSWSRRIAAGLRARGVQPGDHVALRCHNSPEFVALKFGIARAGATCIPVNHHLRARELDYVLTQSDARLLISDEPGHVFVGDLDAPAGEDPVVDPATLSDIIYTSGTTGQPKGVMLTHDQVVRAAYAAAYSRALEDGRRLIFPMPLYHVFGYLECLVAVLFVGGAVAPLPLFNAAELLALVERERMHEIVAVPAVMLPLLDEARRHAHDLSSVHTVFCSGGVTPDGIWDDIRALFGDVEITTGYGMTETSAATTCTLPEGDDAYLRTSNGKLRWGGAAGEIAAYRAVDPVTEQDVPSGAPGHLLVRGPVVTEGYYRKPVETGLAFTDDGWLRTGDLGTLSADGYLRLTGRLKETLRVGGEMVMPKEIEAVLESHPQVSQAYVVGIPHTRMGEVPCAWVVPVRDAQPSADELVAFAAERLARFKVPRTIFVARPSELPVTAVGRVQKFRLAEMSRERLAPPLTGAWRPPRP